MVPLLVALASCQTVPPPPARPASSCGVDRAAAFVGRAAIPAIRAEVAALVGPQTIRWIAPGDVVTMDFNEARLNMMLDASGAIASVRCG